MELDTLADILANPTGLDSLANYMGTIPENEWLYVISQNRDSDALEVSNFRSALKSLGGESENVCVFRVGHWACGWIEHLAVNSGHEQKTEKAKQIVCALSDYPVLNHEDYTAAQYELMEIEPDDIYERIGTLKDNELEELFDGETYHCNELDTEYGVNFRYYIDVEEGGEPVRYAVTWCDTVYRLPN